MKDLSSKTKAYLIAVYTAAACHPALAFGCHAARAALALVLLCLRRSTDPHYQS